MGRALSFGPDVLPGPGPVATQDARPTNRESQGLLRTILRTKFADPRWERPSACLETAVLSSDDGRDRRNPTRAGQMVDAMEAFSIRRTSPDRCDRRVWPDARGHRAVRLLSPRSAPGTYGDDGAGGHVRAVEAGMPLVTTFSTASRPLLVSPSSGVAVNEWLTSTGRLSTSSVMNSSHFGHHWL